MIHKPLGHATIDVCLTSKNLGGVRTRFWMTWAREPQFQESVRNRTWAGSDVVSRQFLLACSEIKNNFSDI